MASASPEEIRSIHEMMSNQKNPAQQWAPDMSGGFPQNYVEQNPTTFRPGIENEVPIPETSWGTAAPDNGMSYGTAEPAPIPFDESNPETSWGTAAPAPVSDIESSFSPRDTNADAANKRQAIVNYLKNQYGASADKTELQNARVSADRTNLIANVGNGLDTMFTARSAAYGGQGADNKYWGGLKADAQERVNQATGDRTASIQDFTNQNNLGRQGIQDFAVQENNDYETARRTPGTPQSLAAVNSFNKIFGEKMRLDPSTYSAIDVEKMVKTQMAKEQQDANNSRFNSQGDIAKGMLGVAKQNADTNAANAATKRAALDKNGNPIPKPLNALQELQKQNLENKMEREKANPPLPPQTPVDRDFAKDYNEWTTDGKAQYQKNRKLLEGAISELEKEDDNTSVSGNFLGRMPDLMRTRQSRRIQSDVQESSQGALRATLGSQFTEREGTLIQKRAYDPTLTPKENIQKIRRAMDQIDSAAAAKDSKAKHYEKRRTLDGWQSADRSALDPQDQKALDWANDPKNVNDPRAQQIKLKLGR